MKTQTYRHRGTGGIYTRLGDAIRKSDTGGDTWTVYVDQDGNLYIREPRDFAERFELVI